MSNNLGISFVYKTRSLKINDERRIKNWIEKVIAEEKKIPGEIVFIFVSEKEELAINEKYLNHNYPTDIITFDKSFLNVISGDIFIAKDVIMENAIKYSAGNITNELYRVIIHGILHLLGYSDATETEKAEMREKENECLNYLERL